MNYKLWFQHPYLQIGTHFMSYILLLNCLWLPPSLLSVLLHVSKNHLSWHLWGYSEITYFMCLLLEIDNILLGGLSVNSNLWVKWNNSGQYIYLPYHFNLLSVIPRNTIFIMLHFPCFSIFLHSPWQHISPEHLLKGDRSNGIWRAIR